MGVVKREPTRFRAFPELMRRRPTKTQIVALTLISLLCFGPIIALGYVVGRPSSPVNYIAVGDEPPRGGAKIEAQILTISPTSGNATVRLTVQPTLGLADQDGPVEDLVLHVNDKGGDTAVTFAAGEPIRPIDVTVALQGQSVERYPFDEYRLALVMKVDRVPGTGIEDAETSDATSDGTSSSGAGSSSSNGDVELEVVPITVDLATEASDFAVAIEPFDEGLTSAADAVGIGFEVTRPATTIAWAIGVMLLLWGLAIVGVMIVWAITIWGIELPFWAMGYFVGVLFAMPPLRESLPGSPPQGTLLDFVSFYWAVGITGVTLITSVGVWLQRARPEKMAPAVVLDSVDKSTTTKIESKKIEK